MAALTQQSHSAHNLLSVLGPGARPSPQLHNPQPHRTRRHLPTIPALSICSRLATRSLPTPSAHTQHAVRSSHHRTQNKLQLPLKRARVEQPRATRWTRLAFREMLDHAHLAADIVQVVDRPGDEDGGEEEEEQAEAALA
eukprot:1406798-Rhodomonas_salina.1